MLVQTKDGVVTVWQMETGEDLLAEIVVCLKHLSIVLWMFIGEMTEDSNVSDIKNSNIYRNSVFKKKLLEAKKVLVRHLFHWSC